MSVLNTEKLIRGKKRNLYFWILVKLKLFSESLNEFSYGTCYVSLCA